MDKHVTDPISSMLTFLADKRDRNLTQQWVIWLTKHDPERAPEVHTRHPSSLSYFGMLMAHSKLGLYSKDTNKRRDNKPEDELALLQQASDADPDGGIRYLLPQKRSAVSGHPIVLGF